ncbi:MAG: hypothetical protein MJ214_00720 [Bacilli bacterium]|nr:hypothetical protein [Bacilli bacterium]
MKKLTSDKKCYLVLGIFYIVAFAALIPTSAVTGLWGLTVGLSIGSVVTFINMVLLFRSGQVVADAAKTDRGVGISLLFYFLRFILIGGAFAICAVMHYTIGIPAFEYSLFTCAASVLPSALIIVIFYRADVDEDNKKIEKK